MNEIINVDELPVTSNLDLSYLERPTRLTREQFNTLPVSKEEADLREKIYKFEDYIAGLPLSYTDVECPFKPVHTVAPGGIYIRTLEIPPNQAVIGYRHAIEHQVILAKGSCLCITERGVEEMVAPMQFVSPAGEKRVVVTRDESCVWITVHKTDETEIDKIEADILINEPDRRKNQLEQREKNRLLEKQKVGELT